MKRPLLMLLALALVLGMVLPMSTIVAAKKPAETIGSDPGISVGSGEVVDNLWAGQWTWAGNIRAWIEDDGEEFLLVQYQPAENWYLTETHLAVAWSLRESPGDGWPYKWNLNGIPQTKKGNPIPGQFPFAEEYPEPIEGTETYKIPLDDILGTRGNAEGIVIAAHAVVVQLDNGRREETAWGNCHSFADVTGARNWAKYWPVYYNDGLLSEDLPQP